MPTLQEIIERRKQEKSLSELELPLEEEKRIGEKMPFDFSKYQKKSPTKPEIPLEAVSPKEPTRDKKERFREFLIEADFGLMYEEIEEVLGLLEKVEKEEKDNTKVEIIFKTKPTPEILNILENYNGDLDSYLKSLKEKNNDKDKLINRLHSNIEQFEKTARLAVDSRKRYEQMVRVFFLQTKKSLQNYIETRFKINIIDITAKIKDGGVYFCFFLNRDLELELKCGRAELFASRLKDHNRDFTLVIPISVIKNGDNIILEKKIHTELGFKGSIEHHPIKVYNKEQIEIFTKYCYDYPNTENYIPKEMYNQLLNNKLNILNLYIKIPKYHTYD